LELKSEFLEDVDIWVFGRKPVKMQLALCFVLAFHLALAQAWCGVTQQNLTDFAAFEVAATDTAKDGELILLIVNSNYAAMGRALTRNMEALGLSNHLTIAFDKETCRALSSERGACCGWSDYLKDHPGWEGWGLQKQGAHAHRLNQTILYVWRWQYISLAIGAGLNVLSMDADVHLLRSPYLDLHGDFWASHAIIAQVDYGQPEAHSCNSASRGSNVCGFSDRPSINTGVVYFQNASGAALALVSGTSRKIVERLDQGAHGPVTNCTNYTCPEKEQPDWDELWDQHVFNELLKEMSGNNWTVGAAPGGTAGVHQPVSWADLGGGKTIAGAPDSMFGRICTVAASLNGSGLSGGIRLGANTNSLEKRSAASCQPPGGAGRQADALAPLLAAHMVFTDNDIREMAWRSLGWWTAAAQPHHHLTRSSCLAGNTSVVLIGRYGLNHAIMCSTRPQDNGCPCCLDLAEAYKNITAEPAAWPDVSLKEKGDKHVVNCNGWFKRGMRKLIV
jgi:hypothetical protein